MMTYKGYVGTFTLDEDDEMFYGKLIGINQLVTFEANNAHDLRLAFFDAVDDYLTFCQEQNIEPDKPFKGSFNVRIGDDLHRRAVIASQGSSLNAFVTEAISEKLSRLSL
ncbi:type II toxin-antitoxin system HicB family antitoxin [Moraxella sp. ZY210820]|uniref:type II toxin-antitoxin system HicB family antitoxin n=1 Tax=unclassified Moraxella TaxID=2685852 RepID=UPI002730FA96|nr:type II toxin-antitoxin system HicB family antitoxin [Moraxella sp. ZY210820]WLF83549.1 type II toxin-antitoxin system HicB family antitoxin [Moraxella sp. ZY210820]